MNPETPARDRKKSRMLTSAIERWVRLVRRHPIFTLLVLLALGALALGYARSHLSLDTSTSDLFSRSLTWRKDEARLDHAFPQLNNTIVVAVDGATPALADQATVKLAHALSADHKHFSYVYAGRNSSFLRQNGLLFQSQSQIHALTHHLTQAQPVLAQLVQQPDLPGLLAVIERVMKHADSKEYRYTAQTSLQPLLDQMATVFHGAAAGNQKYLSWQDLFKLSGSKERNKPNVLEVKPRLNYNEALPAQDALNALHHTIDQLDLTASHGVTVHLTGSVVFQHHDLYELMRDLPLFGGITILLVTALLLAAMRDWRLLIGIVVTLILGLVLTTGFAALAFGRLNLLSIAFVMLYWGMGVDYAIHFCLSYRGARSGGHSHDQSLAHGIRETGTPLVSSAFTTAAAFYVFVLTRFTALSELGIIAGTGMLISLFMTFTALPAFLTLLKPKARPVGFQAGWRFPAPWRSWQLRHRKAILYPALGLGICAALLIPRLHFQVNPIKLRDPHTDAVRTFNRLVKSNPRSAFSISVLESSGHAARNLKRRITKVPEVDSAMDLATWVPRNQTAKLSTLSLWSVLVGPLVPPHWTLQHASPKRQRKAVHHFRQALENFSANAHGSLAASARNLRKGIEDFMTATRQSPHALRTVATGLLAGLPDTLGRLQESLQAKRITLSGLPLQLKRRWLSPQGIHRVAVFPRGNLMNDATLERFVGAVSHTAPHATGTPVIMVRAAELVSHAFLEALAYILVITLAIVWLTFRNLRHTLYTMTPLILGGLLTCAAMVLMGETFNFANVVALPLLFGAGVDYSIHMVDRARRDHSETNSSLSTSATKAVVYSALTTLASFGNLAFTGHGGPASMGLVLALGLTFILLSDLIVLPALLGNGQHHTEKASW